MDTDDEFETPQLLAHLEIGDSKFHGYAQKISTEREAVDYQKLLKRFFPKAAHIVVGYCLSVDDEKGGFNEDGEPPNAAGPMVLREVKMAIGQQRRGRATGIAVGIARYFGNKELGVTSGRLPGLYAQAAKIAMHRYIHYKKTLEQEFLTLESNVYGLAGGDCEIILNIVKDPENKLIEKLLKELKFDGFRGAEGEELPRLQNLQGTTTGGVIPVYRYPGNYHGDEWKTNDWSETSWQIKEAVEEKLAPLYEQEMNHCVTNYYRTGEDFIDHHNDKDLDLNPQGVIVSVTLGDERILELKRLSKPQDVTRVLLPHGSMLVLGPKTNKKFTHSILKKEGSKVPRMSLTFRDVTTFMDSRSGRLFGQGVEKKSIEEARVEYNKENTVLAAGCCAASAVMLGISKLAFGRVGRKSGLAVLGTLALVSLSFDMYRRKKYKTQEESIAREFFSKKSARKTKYHN